MFRIEKKTEPVIYIVSARGTDLFKVGYSTDVHRRIDGMRTGCPHKLDLISVAPGTLAIERWIHSDMRRDPLAEMLWVHSHLEWYRALIPVKRLPLTFVAFNYGDFSIPEGEDRPEDVWKH